MDIVPELGAPVSIQAAMQINIVLTRDPRLNFTSLAKDLETYYPVFYFITVCNTIWSEMSDDLTRTLLSQNATISSDLASPMRLLQGVDTAMPIVGLGIMVLSLISLAFVLFKFRQQLSFMKREKNAHERSVLIASKPD